MSDEHYQTNCRMCDSQDLVEFLNLGHTPLADKLLTAETLRQPEVYYPLNVLLCMSCGLAQLGYVVPAEIMFGDDYPYESSTTQSGRNHFYQMAADIKSHFGFQEQQLAVDIGSNVGVLLSGFKSLGMRVVGIEPAANIADKAKASGITTINAFFDHGSVQEVLRHHSQAAVVTATNVFAHIADLRSFIRSLSDLLLPEGVFVLEAPYFVDLVEKLEYDTIYHEHRSYLSIRPLATFFARHGFEVFDVERVDIHGGSIRVYVGTPGRHTGSRRVEEMMRLEERAGIFSLSRLSDFARQVKAHQEQLVELLRELKGQGKKLVGISAPAKGNTLLNYCRIGTDLLEYLTEKAQLKIGLWSPGMHIPVVDDAQLAVDRPDYGLLLAWNFRDEIVRNLDRFRRSGGKFVVPIPEARII